MVSGYLITGATGHTGGALVRLLHEAGHGVRAFVRSPAAAAKLPDGVEFAVGDLDDPASVRRAVDGVDGIFHMQASHGTGQTATMIAAARAAGVRRIVALSSIGARLFPQPVMGSWFAAREELLRAGGLDVSFLRPNTLMPNALWWADSIRRDGLVTNPCGTGRMSCVDTDDLARVAAAELTRADQDPHGYVLTGPQALTTADQVGILSDVLGTSIEVRDVTPREYAEASVRAGTPAEAAAAMRDLNEMFRTGRSGLVTDDVRNVTGRPPGTFREWCERNAKLFR